MFRALALAVTLFWFLTNVAAACGPPPDHGTANSARTPAATDPAACTVEPRNLSELRQQLIETGSAHATPAPEPEAVTLAELPAGEPADVQTIAAITATTEQLMACLNAGDVLRILVLFSDEFVRVYAADFGFMLEDTIELATPQPMPEDEWVRMGEVTAARVLPDGRVGAVIRAAAPDEEPTFFFFVRDRDRWLIDGFLEIAAEDEECCPSTAEPADLGTDARSGVR